ncbi:hypothetical protein [Paraburkholderia domus]|uniref:hypothetical protein n=1 Tax=Paraburkholderia domus TaxID=2793075 RepID=UPI001B1FA1DB|nr:hypothetical protein [Paraburkholderia domus]CAE6768292.1 hypothetical protein R75483_03888 [Paraburkholderia domus]
MKYLITAAIAVCSMSFITGCSSKKSDFEKGFIGACVSTSVETEAKVKVCKCALSKLEDRHSTDELMRLNLTPTPEFQRELVGDALNCAAEYN